MFFLALILVSHHLMSISPRSNLCKIVNKSVLLLGKRKIEQFQSTAQPLRTSKKFKGLEETHSSSLTNQFPISFNNYTLDHTVSMDNYRREGWTFFHLACKDGDITTIQKLIQQKVNINQPTTFGHTPLYIACLYGQDQAVQLLLENHADVRKKTIYGSSVLHVSCRLGYFKIVELLLDFDLDMINVQDKDGNTALHIACQNNNVSVIELLLHYEPDIDIENKKQQTAQECVLKFSIDTVRINDLFEKHTKYLDLAPFQYFYSLNENSQGTSPISILKILRNKDIDVNLCDFNFNSPLHVACKYQRVKIVQLLLEHQVDLNIVDIDEKTPLHIATQNSHETIVKLLLNNNPDPNLVDNLGRTPLHNAISRGSETIVELLLNNNADPNLIDKWEETPLHRAIANGHYKIVQLLLNHNADPNKKDKRGQTPLLLANSKGHKTVVKLLKGYNKGSIDYSRKVVEFTQKHHFKFRVKKVAKLLEGYYKGSTGHSMYQARSALKKAKEEKNKQQKGEISLLDKDIPSHLFITEEQVYLRDC